MVDEVDRVELGLLCADVCEALNWQTNGKEPVDLSDFGFNAIKNLES